MGYFYPMEVLLICGGGGAEHDISLLSADFFLQHLQSMEKVKIHRVEIDRCGDWEGACRLERGGVLACNGGKRVALHFAIPCIHGSPGEDGRIQSLFELMGLPYLGSGPEASLLAFDKVSTKLWAESLGVPTTPFIFVGDSSSKSLARADSCLQQWGEVFVKPSRQGSSMGMAKVSQKGRLKGAIEQAFAYSSVVLIERAMVGRELELAVYEYGGELQVSAPGEILCPDGFYDYRQKYDKGSTTQTCVEAKGLDIEQIKTLKDYASRVFGALGCRHLARVDFFMTDGGEILLNEINTFPGHTNISMFPMMMENNGHSYRDFLAERMAR